MAYRMGPIVEAVDELFKGVGEHQMRLDTISLLQEIAESVSDENEAMAHITEICNTIIAFLSSKGKDIDFSYCVDKLMSAYRAERAKYLLRDKMLSLRRRARGAGRGALI